MKEVNSLATATAVACACSFFLRSTPATADQEVWFVGDILNPNSNPTCADDQDNAKKVAQIVNSLKGATGNPIILMTEANNCKD